MALDFMPDWRSVYFQSLATYPGYEDIYAQSQMALGNIIDTNVEQRWINDNRFTVALQILAQGIITEKAAEQEYINTLLSNPILNDAALSNYKQRLSHIFSSENIDYIELIKLLNEILLGVDNFKSILTLESKRLKELDVAMKKLKSQELEKEREANKSNKNILTEQQLNDKIKKDIRNIYLQQHTYADSRFADYFQDITPTIDNILADYVQKACNTILQSEEFFNQFETNWLANATKNELTLDILASVLGQINTQIPKIVQRIINDNQYNKTNNEIINDLISQATDNIETFNLENEKLFRHGNFTGLSINKQKEIETSGEQLADQLLNVYLAVNEKSTLGEILQSRVNKRKKDSVTIYQLLQKIDMQMNRLQESINKNMSDDSLKAIKYNITRLKQQVSTAVHKQLKNKLANAVSQQAKKDLMQSINASFSQSSIKISGPTFSEVIDKIIQNKNLFSQTFWSGSKNQKVDTITITLNPNPIHTTLNFSTQEIQNEIDNLIKDKMNDFYTDFTDNIHANLGFSLERGKTAWEKAVDENYKKLTTTIAEQSESEEELAKKLQQLAEEIKNSIVVTSTMKTFNKYNNEIGFVNGTLGATIGAQLDNIQSLFTSAGVPLSKAELSSLKVLIVNCSDATLGASNRPALEKFLSSLAGFAIFDEGSAEVQMIANSMTNNYVSTSPRLMHLYKLNGLYFPGSFILQRIYDNLQNTAQDLQSQEKNTDGVQILATASEALIRSHKISGAQRWADVYQRASSKDITSINVTFLSNLVNIVGQLLDSFNNI